MSMISIPDFCKTFPAWLNPDMKMPWQVLESLEELIRLRVNEFRGEFEVRDNYAIHRSAVIEQNVMLKGNGIISANTFVAANSYLRGPVFLGEHVSIGPGCEIKHSVILQNTNTAHFNYIGNCIVGSNVNFEAGAICANHYNERTDKSISVLHKGARINTGIEKFGALVGDYSRIGANAVLSPGTLLPIKSIVDRLALIDQSGYKQPF